MEYIKVRNWDIWQTYRKDRGQPPWIKVHRRVMRNIEWVSLTDAERGQLVSIWLLAADHEGVIPASPEMIQKICFMSDLPDLNKFTELGFLEDGWRHTGVGLASPMPQDVTPKAEAKAETEENRKESEQAQAFSILNQEELDNASIPMIKNHLQKLTEEIYQKGLFPKINAFVNKMLKEKKNHRAIIHCLNRLYLKRPEPEKAWAYCMKVIQVEDGNYYERDSTKSY